MKTKQEHPESGDAQAFSAESLVGEVCCRFSAVRIGDRALCPDCYHGCGSCCPEFGKDDLWSFSEDQRRLEKARDWRC